MIKPNLLLILDGWGYSPSPKDNAVAQAKTPNLDYFIDHYPNGLLKCSGLDVGLPAGLMGNSEVGHLNIGAGRIVYQDLTRIDKAIEDKSFFSNKELLKAFTAAEERKSRVHVMMLLSDGGVHSHIRHLEAILQLAKSRKFHDLIIHPIFDGRDTAPKIGYTYLEKLLGWFKEYGVGSLGSLAGRFYTMDRDTRWDRVERGYNAMVAGTPLITSDPVAYIRDCYHRDIGDEFIEPVCVNKANTINDDDAIIFLNFRSDRARQITRSLTDKDFNGFRRSKIPRLSYYVCLTEYDEKFNLPVAFPSPTLTNIFGEVVSKKGLKQLRIAETEKYAHVTFFFNGGVEAQNPGEDRILIDSPRDIPTYDLKPEMSAYKVTERILKELDKDEYSFIVLNFANCDMVGHTGIFDAAVKAVEVIDECAGKVINKVLKKDGLVFLTADHGNAEQMKDEHGQPHTAHTTNDVRYVIISNQYPKGTLKLRDGRLADIMPTMLSFMKVDIPSEVTGESLVLPVK